MLMPLSSSQYLAFSLDTWADRSFAYALALIVRLGLLKTVRLVATAARIQGASMATVDSTALTSAPSTRRTARWCRNLCRV